MDWGMDIAHHCECRGRCGDRGGQSLVEGELKNKCQAMTTKYG